MGRLEAVCVCGCVRLFVGGGLWFFVSVAGCMGVRLARPGRLVSPYDCFGRHVIMVVTENPVAAEMVRACA